MATDIDRPQGMSGLTPLGMGVGTSFLSGQGVDLLVALMAQRLRRKGAVEER